VRGTGVQSISLSYSPAKILGETEIFDLAPPRRRDVPHKAGQTLQGWHVLRTNANTRCGQTAVWFARMPSWLGWGSGKNSSTKLDPDLEALLLEWDLQHAAGALAKSGLTSVRAVEEDIHMTEVERLKLDGGQHLKNSSRDI